MLARVGHVRQDHVPDVTTACQSDHPIIRPTVPFVVCHANVIGPIEPSSAKRHKWALRVGDQVAVLEKDSTHKTFARWKQGKITKVRSPQLHGGNC